MCAAPVIDILPKSFASQIIKEVFDQNQTDTRGLASDIKIKVYSSVMLIVNVDCWLLSERLVNGLLKKHISENMNGKVTKIYVKFEDAETSQMKINKDDFLKRHSAVPVETFKTDMKLKPNFYLVIKRTQFPIMLASVYTVHRC